MISPLKNLLIAIVIACGATFAASAASPRVTYRYAAMPRTATSPLTADLVVDSVMFRDDVTRVYGHITGLPHTSARIDGFIITSDPRGKLGAGRATDIDGFDFERRFQWEDSGDIPVEIDFPKMSPENTLFIDAIFPGGRKGWKLTRITSRKK